MRQYKHHGTRTTIIIRITPPQPLPPISEDTHSRLLEELELDTTDKTKDIIEGITGEKKDADRSVSAMTNQVFGDLIGINRNFVQTLFNGLEEAQPPHSEATDYRTVGMALVLRAFDINSNFDLISRFKNLQEEDLAKVRGALQIGLSRGHASNIPILKRLLIMPRVPDHQMSLNNVINQVCSRTFHGKTFGAYIQEGAGTMYNVLGIFWPDLYPNQSPTPELPPQPQSPNL